MPRMQKARGCGYFHRNSNRERAYIILSSAGHDSQRIPNGKCLLTLNIDPVIEKFIEEIPSRSSIKNISHCHKLSHGIPLYTITQFIQVPSARNFDKLQTR